jgi:hypothetical protein
MAAVFFLMGTMLKNLTLLAFFLSVSGCKSPTNSDAVVASLKERKNFIKNASMSEPSNRDSIKSNVDPHADDIKIMNSVSEEKLAVYKRRDPFNKSPTDVFEKDFPSSDGFGGYLPDNFRK